MSTNTPQTGSLKTILLLFVSLSLLNGCSVVQGWFTPAESKSNASIEQLKSDELEAFVRSIKPVYGNPDNHYRLGRYFQTIGRHTIAVDEFVKALAMDPGYSKAYNAMGVSYDSLGKHGLAQAAYRAALELSPDSAYILNNLGYSNMLSGNMAAAVGALEKASSLNPENTKYRNNLRLAAAGAVPAAGDSSVNAMPASPVKAELPSYLSQECHAKTFAAPKTAIREPEPDTAPPEVIAPQGDAYALQIGAFSNVDRARYLAYTAAEKGVRDLYITRVSTDNPYYRVRQGRFRTLDQAEAAADTLTRVYGLEVFTVYEKAPPAVFTEKPSGEIPGTADPEPQDLAFSVEVSNGNGVRHMARQVGLCLEKIGFEVDRLSNAEHFNHTETKIFYAPGHYKNACRLARELPDVNITTDLAEQSDQEYDIRILLGKDLVPFRYVFRKGFLQVRLDKDGPSDNVSALAQNL